MSTDQPPPPGYPPPGYPLYPRYTGAPPLEPGGRRNFLIGLGLGLIPGIFAIISFSSFSPGANILFSVSVLLYLAVLVAWIVLVSIKRTRRIGLGMLTGWAIDPVIFFIACVVALSHGPVI